MDATKFFAAIDQGSDISAVVYGVGTSEAAALRDAKRGADGDYAIVPCTKAAYDYVKQYGGAPSHRLCVSWRANEGVSLRSEEE